MAISRREFIKNTAALAGSSSAASAKPSPDAAIGRRFTGEGLREIAFPLGGIGTGTIALSGYGSLREWEIFNRPNKNTTNPYTFAALRLSGGGLKSPIGRVLEREPLPPFSQSLGMPRGMGLPRFREAVFTGAYPFATVDLQDSAWPVEVVLEAFNPMVPLEVAISSLPVAILTYRIRSRATSPLAATLAFSTMNPVGYDRVLNPAHRKAACFGRNVNEFLQESGVSGILMSSRKYAADSFRFGTVALTTSAPDVSYRVRWEHGALWDDVPLWWREFIEKGRFPNNDPKPSEGGFSEYATLAAHFRLQPGETHHVPIVLSWHFPNIEDYWTGLKPYFISQKVSPTRLMRNQYGAQWKSAWEPAVHTLRNLDSLREKSQRYRDALHASTLPPEMIDAISTQTSTTRTNTVMVEEGGRVLAFEGCADDQGSCPMNCTHVYNYEQSLAHLYPSLERSMRDTDFLFNVRDDGYMSFRTATPVQHGAYTKKPAADGQVGSILKLYREWMLGGSDEWLRSLWPSAKKALEFAWKEWDKDCDGVMEGDQHNTYDVGFIGPNTFTGTLYLGALRAASRIAQHLGDTASASRYQDLYEKGSRALDLLLWNGSYYVQKTDAAKNWQYGPGCLSDQLIGQWFAEIVDLGKLLPRDHIRKALQAVARNNFRTDFHDFPGGGRGYALNDEQGLLVCTWPEGGRPALPFGYVDEVWTGVEYQVAAHLVYEGMLDDASRIVKAVRERHNGARRNPWDELEAGHHYARGMSSWSLLTAYSGFAFSAPEKSLRFVPAARREAFRSLFSTGTSWGTFAQSISGGALTVELRIEGGTLELSTLRLQAFGAGQLHQSSVPAQSSLDKGVTLVQFPKGYRSNETGALTLKII